MLMFLATMVFDVVGASRTAGVVHGVVGHPISLPCEITPPAPGDSPHLILWYKDIFGTPIYSVDGRNGIHTAKHWSDTKIFNNREKFYITEEGGTIMAYLNISKTKPADAGPYRCRVDFWKAATRNIKISVDLAEEVNTVNLFNGKGILVTNRIISSRINGSVKITCRAFGGFPKPSIHWKIGDKHMHTVNMTERDNEVFSSIQLNNLQIADSGKQISCFAKNNELYPAPNVSVKVEIVLAPVRVEISRTISTFVVGKSYNLTCQVLGSNPIPTTFLWVRGNKLENIMERESRDGNIFNIVANFIPTFEDDGAFVSCRALNKYLPREAIEDQWMINVVYPPISIIAAKMRNSTDQSKISVEIGKGIVLECIARANPRPFEYHWRLNKNKKVTSLASSSSTLVLTDITRHQAGSYTCLAENIQGLGESEPIHLDVLYPPLCKEGKEKQVFISVHESVDLSCEMESNPKNLSFKWQLNPEVRSDLTEYIDVPSSQFTQHETKSVLTLTPRTPGDFGRVKCSATNYVGKGTSCMYVIKKKVITFLKQKKNFMLLHMKVFADTSN